jgi:eukaryotic-like serine/threonine-protein kinase
VFSPDGTYLAYASDETGQTEVYVRPFPGPGSTRIVSAGGADEPAWKGTELFYRRLHDRRMMAVEVKTAPSLTIGPQVGLPFGEQFFPRQGNRFPMAQYDVTPDGQRFLMLREAAVESGAVMRQQVVTVHNWLEELKRLVPVD